MRFNKIIARRHAAAFCAMENRTIAASGWLRHFGNGPKVLILLTCVAYASGTTKAVAQVVVPGINAPPLPPRPTPPIQVPTIPESGGASQPNPPPLIQNTFADRVSQCMQTAGAAGLTEPNLDAYVRLCVSQ